MQCKKLRAVSNQVKGFLNKKHIGIKSTVPCSTVEPLNKGHIGIRSTVPCSTVEPLNKGHIGLLFLVVQWNL